MGYNGNVTEWDTIDGCYEWDTDMTNIWVLWLQKGMLNAKNGPCFVGQFPFWNVTGLQW